MCIHFELAQLDDLGVVAARLRLAVDSLFVLNGVLGFWFSVVATFYSSPFGFVVGPIVGLSRSGLRCEERRRLRGLQGLVTMQALVRLARRSSLQQALPSFQQDFLTRAAAQSGLEGSVGDGVDGASTQVQEGGGEAPPPTPVFAGFPGVAPPAVNMNSSKVYARLSNCPKYAFKSDILAYFEGCNLQPHQLVTIYDDKYRQRFIQLEFDNVEGFRQAQRTIVRQGRLAGRYLKLDLESRRYDEDKIHNDVKEFRGHSLLMMQVPNEATHEDVVRFFQGYNLASFSTKFLTVQKDLPAYVTRRANTTPTFERRALVKFSSPLEASRALRAKHGQFCLNKGIDLRFVQ